MTLINDIEIDKLTFLIIENMRLYILSGDRLDGLKLTDEEKEFYKRETMELIKTDAMTKKLFNVIKNLILCAVRITYNNN